MQNVRDKIQQQPVFFSQYSREKERNKQSVVAGSRQVYTSQSPNAGAFSGMEIDDVFLEKFLNKLSSIVVPERRVLVDKDSSLGDNYRVVHLSIFENPEPPS